MNPIEQFFSERKAAIEQMGLDEGLRTRSVEWMVHADRYKYTYNFSWMGRPIIKFPADMVVQQEVMWRTKPDLVIETGIAHGGSIIFSASMLQMMGIDGRVIGIDVDIRSHNREAIENHPMFDRITMFEGSSTDEHVVNAVRTLAMKSSRVMVILDSLHSHSHVLQELRLYAPMVTVGCYLILPDTFIEFFPKGYYSQTRPWDVGDNPYTAMQEFLSQTDDFVIDKELSAKAQISEAIDGYLLRTK